MNKEWRVLGIRDLELILSFERDGLNSTGRSEIERMMDEWNSSWRKESLEHYLAMGWSMAAWVRNANGEELAGYFLAQPFLFFQGKTQVLWVELLRANSDEVRAELVDIAYKLSREKHLQSVLFNSQEDLAEILEKYKRAPLTNPIFEVMTTKRG